MIISSKPILLLLFIVVIAQHAYSQVVDHNYKSTVHTFNEAWNTGKVDLLDEVVHPEYLKLEGKLELKGIEALKEYVRTYRASYADVKITYIDEVYGDKKAAINFTVEATPKENGKKYISEGIVIFRFRDGKIVEDHSVFDQLSALKQQGYKIIEPEKIRVVLDTDANNELDDQHAIAYLLFNGDFFDVEGITVNKTSNGGDVGKHYEEAERVVKLCDLHGKIDIYTGANGSFEEIKDHIDEPDFDGKEAVDFIIERAHAKSERKLVLLPVGKLTNIALALKKDPSIASKIRIVWLGSNYPDPGEYNQVNDISSMQYVLDANVDLEMVMVRYDKPSGTDAVRALLSEIEEIMPGKGPAISTPVTGRHGNEFTNFGDYSISLFRNIEEYHGDPPSRALFDMAAVAIVKNSSWATPKKIPSPEYVDGTWIERPGNPHEITIWENFDKESILDDFYASMEDYVLVHSMQEQKISKEEYKDRLKGFWLGGCIGNWTGLPTENRRTDFPFFTDEDFGPGKYDYVLDEDPWGADDDTDIEYVYQHAIETNDQYKLTGEQISEAWQNHIGLPKLWVSNLSALGQMQNGAIPPETSLPENNPMWDMIDAQLTTEIFGALAPGRPGVALDIAHLPIRTTAYLHSEWASEFYVIMHSLVAVVNQSLPLKDQVSWLAEQARKRIPDWSYIADMYDFVKAAYEANPDKDNWELTRDKVAQRYQHNITAGYHYKYPWDSGINFAASMISLFYGEGDYKKTIRIGCMCGWDSDNPTSTWGGLLGLLYGHDKLQSHFNKTDFSDAYYIERSRYNMPIPLDNFDDMAERGLDIIDDIVIGEMDGSIEGDHWIIPEMKSDIIAAAVPKTKVPWLTIEDNDPRWIFSGFESYKDNWNASGATLAFGYENCKAEITFTGKAVQYYAYRSPLGGKVTISLDGISYGEFNLENHHTHGQHYVKIFEKLGLKSGSHTLIIQGDKDKTEKTIDMLSIVK